MTPHPTHISVPSGIPKSTPRTSKFPFVQANRRLSAGPESLKTSKPVLAFMGSPGCARASCLGDADPVHTPVRRALILPLPSKTAIGRHFLGRRSKHLGVLVNRLGQKGRRQSSRQGLGNAR